MIPYLLAENPNLPASQAFSLSKQMTTGQKMDYSRHILLRNWTTICTTISRSYKSRGLFDFKTTSIGGIIYV